MTASATAASNFAPGTYGPMDDLAVRTIRTLAMDAVQAAGNGHPGTAMALAPLAHVLYSRILRYDVTDPHWFDRDRFVLSPGHASILLYSMLYLTGQGHLELEDLKQFRKFGSNTPGHPERTHTPGIEVTTGPLGQGIANAVGLALAEANLRARFGNDLCNHHTFAIVSDGDLMEGISHEAASLAGHLGLGHLVCVYDDNHITIDGPTELALTDDAAMRFRSYGWHVLEVGEIANDMAALEAALREGIAETSKPTLIVLRSHIGYPSPAKTDTSAAHGSPLGAEEVATTKALMGAPSDAFVVDDSMLAAYRAHVAEHGNTAKAWKARFDASTHAATLRSMINDEPAPGWDAALPVWKEGSSIATREASGECLNAISGTIPALIGGGADLTGNTGTMMKSVGRFSKETPDGRLIHFGIREHAMAAIMNGMAAHGATLPFGGTFFVFSDYMRGAIRVGALSELKVVHSWTHDSIGVGEDGPTHQPIEHLASLRAMPGLRLIRPADGNEVAAAWRVAVEAAVGPTGLVLSRQKVPTLPGTSELAYEGVARGAYVLVDPPSGEPDVVLVGTGSEVQLCVEAAKELTAMGHEVRVVSMPSWDLFDEQDDEYQLAVMPPHCATVACEAGTSFGWERWSNIAVTIDTWGASGDAAALYEEYGINAESIVHATLMLLDEYDENEV